MAQADAQRTVVERLEHQLQRVVATMTPGTADAVSIHETGDHARISLPEPWRRATVDLLAPLDLVQEESESLVVQRDDLWRVIRHIELALPESEQLRRKVEEGKLEPLPGLIRFGSVSRAMPLPHWDKLSEDERARVEMEQGEAEDRARVWAEELRMVGARSLARFRESIG